jgi:hypothetical protein
MAHVHDVRQVHARNLTIRLRLACSPGGTHLQAKRSRIVLEVHRCITTAPIRPSVVLGASSLVDALGTVHVGNDDDVLGRWRLRAARASPCLRCRARQRPWRRPS